MSGVEDECDIVSTKSLVRYDAIVVLVGNAACTGAVTTFPMF